MAEMNSIHIAGVSAGKWNLNGTRCKNGVRECMLTDLHGNEVVESVQDCAKSLQSRAWVNPPGEIEHIREYSDFLTAQKKPRSATVGMDCVAPFGVYLNGEQVAEFNNERDASVLFNKLTGRQPVPALESDVNNG
jgi:hypothetical protein